MGRTGGGDAGGGGIVVLGGGTTGVATAECVRSNYGDVTFLDRDPHVVEAAAALGASTHVVDVTDGEALEAALAGSIPVELAIVTVEPDAAALLVGQLAKTKLDAETVVVLLDEPQNRAAFETAGMIPVCTTTAVADAVAATLSLASVRTPNGPAGSTVATESTGPLEPRRSG